MIEEHLLKYLNSLGSPATKALEIALRQGDAPESFETSINSERNSCRDYSNRRIISFDMGEIASDMIPVSEGMSFPTIEWFVDEDIVKAKANPKGRSSFRNSNTNENRAITQNAPFRSSLDGPKMESKLVSKYSRPELSATCSITPVIDFSSIIKDQHNYKSPV
jgi:hypothetical protein